MGQIVIKSWRPPGGFTQEKYDSHKDTTRILIGARVEPLLVKGICSARLLFPAKVKIILAIAKFTSQINSALLRNKDHKLLFWQKFHRERSTSTTVCNDATIVYHFLLALNPFFSILCPLFSPAYLIYFDF